MTTIKYSKDSTPEGYKPCRIYIRPSKYFPTIEEQEKVISEYCKENKYHILATYIDDNVSFSINLDDRRCSRKRIKNSS
jgi:hypothetical protein